MPSFILLMQGHLVYIMQMMSFTQITTTILNKLTPTYNSIHYDIMYKNKSSQSEGSASSDLNGHSGDVVSRLSAHAPCHNQQTLPCISLPQHLPSCLLLEDSGYACSSLKEPSWLLQCSSSPPARGLLGSD